MEEMSHPAEAGSTQAAPKDTRLIYEVGFHVVPTVEESKVGEVVEKIRKVLDSAKAEVIGEQFPAKMQLAYTIERSTTGKREKYNDAYFGWMKFAVEDRESIPALEAVLRNTHEVLRSLLVQSSIAEVAAPRRAVFSSNRLEGETIKKPTVAVEEVGVVSEADLDKSIDALVSEEKI